MIVQIICSILFLGVLIISSFLKYCPNNEDNHIKLFGRVNEMEYYSTFSIMHDCNDHDDDDEDANDVRINRHRVEAIYQFGDSISDTGNYLRDNPSSCIGRFPYGETYFEKPTGRCSDGLLIIDFLANFLKLPFLQPYLNQNGDFTHGANFAVVGATALDTSTLETKSIESAVANRSLSVQLGWFKSHVRSICVDTSECKRKLAKALFVVGEIGGNDYNYAITQNHSSILYPMAPEIAQTISNVVEELINLGAIQIIIPGHFLIGCMTVHLSIYKSNDPSVYDDLGCISSLNEFTKFHNDQVRLAINKLRKKHPHVTIVYMDLAKAMRLTLEHASSNGFNEKVMYNTCCGSGNEDNYNYNHSKTCGDPGVTACPHPEEHVSWDGYHLTHHTHQAMAKWLINHLFL